MLGISARRVWPRSPCREQWVTSSTSPAFPVIKLTSESALCERWLGPGSSQRSAVGARRRLGGCGSAAVLPCRSSRAIASSRCDGVSAHSLGSRWQHHSTPPLALGRYQNVHPGWAEVSRSCSRSRSKRDIAVIPRSVPDVSVEGVYSALTAHVCPVAQRNRLSSAPESTQSAAMPAPPAGCKLCVWG